MTMIDNRINKRIEPLLRWNYLWLALCAIGIAIFLIVMPKYLDDWEFSLGFRPWFESQGLVSPQKGGNIWIYDFPKGAIWDAIERHFEWDTSRFSNILGIILLLFPKWIAGIPATLCWIYSMYASLRLAKLDIGQSTLIPLAIFMWILGLPWYDNMACVMYQVNYFIGTAIVLWLFLVIRSPRKDVGRYILIFLLSFIGGTWHDMIAPQLIAAFTAVLIICRPENKKTYIISLAGLVLAMVWLMSFPGFYVRAEVELWQRISHVKDNIKILLVHYYVVILFWVISSIFIYRVGWKKYLKNELLVCILVFTAFSAVFAVATNAFMRAGWLGNYFSIIGIMYMLKTLFPEYPRHHKGRVITCNVLLLVLSLGTLLLSDYYIIEYSREYRKACEIMGDGERDAIFVDIDPTDVTPFPAQRFIGYQLGWDMYCFPMEYYMRQDEEDFLKIVPKRLEDFSFEDGWKVPGKNEIRIIDGKYLVVPYDEKNHDGIFFDTDFGPVHKDEVPFMMIPFNNRHDGKRYAVLIMTDRQIFKQLLGIDRMDLSSNYTPRIYRVDRD